MIKNRKVLILQIDSLFKKEYLFCGLAVILFVLFHKPLENLLANTLVKYVLADVKTWWVNDVILTILAVGMLLTFISGYIKGYVISQRLFLSGTILTIVYIVYRFFTNVWCYTHFEYFKHLCYSDITLILGFGMAGLYALNLIQAKSQKAANKDHVNELFDDAPLGQYNEDLLGYTNYASTLANKIKNSRFDRAFAIGLNGKWGSGKTSFIDLMKRELKKDDSILIIDFNSWNSHNPTAIIRDFFETVQDKLKPYHSSVSSLLLSYANKLLELHSNDLTKVIHTSVSFLTGMESAEGIKTEISKVLERINKKLIVIIDDLDRLDKNEIVEVLRLIRNTANFRNTFFIVAYDKGYVTKALKKHNAYNEQHFLEKIFQVEVNLPQYSSNILNVKLAAILKIHLGENYHEDVNEALIGPSYPRPLDLTEWLTHMRDVSLLMNSLSINLTGLLNNVYLRDLIVLELMRLKYPVVYTLLYTERNQFFEFEKIDRIKSYYKLKEIGVERNNALTEYLKTHHKDIQIKKSEIPKIIKLLEEIFPQRSDVVFAGAREDSHLSIKIPNRFERYFQYNLQEGQLSETEFLTVITLPLEKIKNYIDVCVANKMDTEIVSRFGLIRTFNDKEQFEKIITAIFYLSNKKSLYKNYHYNQLIGFENDDLMAQLSDYKKRLSDKTYNGDTAALNVFILSLLNNAPYPYLNEADFIRTSTHLLDSELSVPKEVLLKINVTYFSEYCRLSDSVDPIYWYLYHCCQLTDWIPEGTNVHRSEKYIPENVKEIAISFITEKALDSFLLGKIERDREEKIYGLQTHYFAEDWTSFKKVIFELDESKWKYLKEFKVFYSELEKENMNMTKYIPFDFKDIPVDEKYKKDE